MKVPGAGLRLATTTATHHARHTKWQREHGRARKGGLAGNIEERKVDWHSD
jgi:hypothetical protein